MKFLITGAYGFVGSNLCRYLTDRGHVCEALDVAAARRADVPYAAAYTWDELETIAAQGRPFLSAYDAIVHLAGKAHDTRNVTEPKVYFDVNVGLAERVFGLLSAECRAHRPARKVAFVYFSSIKALDGDTPYAQSKREAEKVLAAAAGPVAESVALAVLQPAMIHGPGNKGNLNLLVQVVRRGIPWPLAAFENRRSFTSIGNACAAVEALCAGRVPGTFPLCDDEPVSTNRLIGLIAEAYGGKARLLKLPQGLMRAVAAVGSALHLPLDRERLGKLTESAVVDNSKLKERLGWQAMPVRAEDGLRETLKSFRESGR